MRHNFGAIFQRHVRQEPFVPFDEAGGDKGCGKLHRSPYNMSNHKETTDVEPNRCDARDRG